jgi:rhamnosyltransferase
LKTLTARAGDPAGSPSTPTAGPAADALRWSNAGVRVLAVIVGYEPDRDELGRLVETLRANAFETLIVDNSESEVGRASAHAVAAAYGADYVGNPLNIGVAAAQNVGLRVARERGKTHVLLLDQDSTLQRETVDRLIAAFVALRDAGQAVAAVGPSLVDPRTGYRAPFPRLRHVRMQKLHPAAGEVVDCDVLISSGCLISLAAVERVGPLDEALFIDYVDFEWCVRARALGFQVFGVGDAELAHTIGDSPVRILGRVISLHSPVRNYYFIRNALLFLGKPYLSLRWRAHLLYRVAAQFVLFGLLCPQRPSRIAWMLRGLWDGARGRGGRLGGPAGLKPLRPQWKSTRPPAAADTDKRDLPLVTE